MSDGDAKVKRRRPGRPRANRAVYSFKGRVEEPLDPGLVVEAKLPTPQNFRNIVNVFRSLNIFYVTFAFREQGIFIFGTGAHVKWASESSRPPRLVVFIPCEDICSYYLQEDITVPLPRTELERCCDDICRQHEYVTLGLGAERRQMSLRLESGKKSFTTQWCTIGEPLPGLLELPANARGPEAEADGDDAAEEGAAGGEGHVEEVMTPDAVLGEVDIPSEYECHWQVDGGDLCGVLSHTRLTNSSNFGDHVTFSAHGDSGKLEYQLKSTSPTAAPSVSEIHGVVQGIKEGVYLNARYPCIAFSIIQSLATASHLVNFYMDNHAALVATVTPQDISRSTKSTILMGSCYFRLEIPAYQM